MKAKQKFSVAVSTLLPALALVGYLSLAPAKVQAQGSCPDGEIYTPGGDGGCQSGAGYVYYVGQNGHFVFCPNQDGTYGGVGGPGECVSAGCVQCEYGS